MLFLPLDVLRLIYAFDPTYRHLFNLCLLQLGLCCSASTDFPGAC
jgi:hypothetical protein